MKIKKIFISPGHNFVGRKGLSALNYPTEEKQEVNCLAGRGLDGDRYLDFKEDYKGQMTLFDEAVYLELCETFKVNHPIELLRRQVITQGLDLNTLIGKRFSLQGVQFLGTEEARPCFWMNEVFAEGALQAMAGKGGLRVKILTDGALRVGEAEFKILEED
jgi:MOSC domain-containing protein YiiM